MTWSEIIIAVQQLLLIFEIDKSYTLAIEEKPIAMFTNLRPLLLFDNKDTFCKNCQLTLSGYRHDIS